MTGVGRLAVLASVLGGLAHAPAPAHAGRSHGGWHGYHPRPRVFIGGSVAWDPFFAPYYYYPYYVPYYVPSPPYLPPPPEDLDSSAPPDEESPGTPPGEDDARQATYGLVQLRGVPAGTAVDLDGRFWLTAADLDTRWLALPAGDHRLVVHVDGDEPVTRTITVLAGKTLAVRLGPLPRRRS